MHNSLHPLRRNPAPTFVPHRRGRRAVAALVMAALAMLCPSCQQAPTSVTADDDSLSLHVALMPTADCLPIYVASHEGIYDSLGLNLRLLTYQAQIDTDTALLRGHADVAYTDIIRSLLLRERDSLELRIVASTEGTLTLLTPQRSRTRRLSQLRERMVAVARHSVTDYLSDALTDSASLARNDIFRPQINSLRIRTDMLCNATLDAAFLPEPHATEARLRGHTQLGIATANKPRLLAFAATESTLADSFRLHQLALLTEGYELARQRLNAGQRRSLSQQLHDLAGVPDTLCDTIVTLLPQFQPLRRPRRADADAALSWLRSRSQAPAAATTDRLLADSLVLTTLTLHND